jgi:glucose/arabinose dehydrogenase
VIYIREVRANHLRSANLFTRTPSGTRLQSRRHAFRVETVVEGVEHPWAIAFAADGRMFVTERAGRLRIVEKGRLLPEPVSGTPAVWVRGQGGLLDVAVGRDLEQREWIYLSYAEPGPSGTAMTALVRGRVVDGSLVDQEILFRARPDTYRLSIVHFGSRIVLDGQGLVYFSVGERGHASDAQDLARSNGKIHRLRQEGLTPDDNPLVGRRDVLDTIWSYGHRNPQGLARHPVTGELWEAEHGPRGGDELNRIVRGGNYGWPLVSFGMNHTGTAISAETERDGLESPVYQWTPSITVSSIEFYTGDKFPGWRHDLLVGSLVSQDVRRLVIDRGAVVEEEVLFAGFGRVRDLITGPDGYVYITLNAPDRVVRLVPASPDEAAAMR